MESIKYNEKNAEKMITDLDKYLYKYENRFPKIKKVDNISRSDIEFAIFYAEHFIRGSYYSLMEPFGNTRKLLEAYKVI